MMAVVVVVEMWLFVMLWIRKIQTRLIALRYLFPLERGWNWIRGEKRKGAYDSRPSLKDHQHKIRVLELDFGRWSCLSNVSIPRGDRQYVINELKERREREREREREYLEKRFDIQPFGFVLFHILMFSPCIPDSPFMSEYIFFAEMNGGGY